ncbi:hypothetical protein [Fretibacter rubidus]|uniref:hypothetical protein n=1 Tax=Fretibacter rubidus TaxID=570162 RepID=UPI00352B5193
MNHNTDINAAIKPPVRTVVHSGLWLPRLTAIRVLAVLVIAMGYASTMPLGPQAHEIGAHLGYQPSWIGVQILFFFSGLLALRSLQAGRYGWTYLKSRIRSTWPVLIAITASVVLVVYPMCADVGQWNVATLLSLATYFFLTITGLDPGRPLPGLLDDAAYTCLIQGAIWTLRWGLVFHIGAAVLGRYHKLIQPPVLLGLSVLTTGSYVAITYLAVQNDWQNLIAIITALRLAYAFVIGMTVWAYRDKLPTSLTVKTAVIATAFVIATAHHYLGPWSPLIEISLCVAWGYSAYLLATSTTPKLSWADNWPALTAALYMLNWPIAQLLLMGFPNMSGPQLVGMTLPLTVLIAGLLYGAMTGRLLRKITVQTARL